MARATVQCLLCGNTLPRELYNQAEAFQCPICRETQLVISFPALEHATGAGRGAEALLVEGESSCFYHPRKKAVVPCEECGRFLCGMCEVEMQGRRLCPACIHTGKEKNRIEQLQVARTLYDELALALAIAPLLCFPLTLITAPVAIYFCVRHWNSPGSLLPRTKIRFVLAFLFALVQIIGWIFFISHLIR